MTLECELTQISMGVYLLSIAYTHTGQCALGYCLVQRWKFQQSHLKCKSACVAAAERVTADHRLQFNPTCVSSQVVAELLASVCTSPLLHFHTKILTSLLRFRRRRLICPGANIFSSMCTL